MLIMWIKLLGNYPLAQVNYDCKVGRVISVLSETKKLPAIDLKEKDVSAGARARQRVRVEMIDVY